MIRTLIVDDEPVARSYLRSLLNREDDIDVVGECRNGDEALLALREATPDLVFLDIQMPGLDGFEVMRQHGAERMPPVIFVTAFDDYAVRAFEVHALDYLLKPFDPERFSETLQRARRHMRERVHADVDERLRVLLESVDVANGREPYRERLAVKKGEESILLHVSQIDWVESDANYAVLHVGKQAHVVRATLTSLERELDPRRFVRIHRTAIVNVERIARLAPWGHGDYRVFLHDGQELNLSRRYKDRLRSIIRELS